MTKPFTDRVRKGGHAKEHDFTEKDTSEKRYGKEAKSKAIALAKQRPMEKGK